LREVKLVVLAVRGPDGFRSNLQTDMAMNSSPELRRIAAISLLGVAVAGASGCKPTADTESSAASINGDASQSGAASAKPHADLSGRTRFGKASFYAQRFAGREMADGSRMDPHGDNAASKTLPLGTTAIVTNTETGQSAQVTIQDRGPYVSGRIVDLSPSTAKKIGITQHKGVATVSVAPLAVAMPDGSTKPGAATPGAGP
jgi:rare lipoprotein A